MPTALTTTEKNYPTPTGPAGGEPRTASSVRSMGAQIASSVRWAVGRINQIFGTPLEVESVDATADTITITGHGLVDDDIVRIESIGGSVPGGLSSTVTLYAIAVDADTIQVSFVASGSAVDLSSAGSGTLYIWKVPAALDAIQHTAFTTLAGSTIPAGALHLTLAAYAVWTKGATMLGDLVMGNGGRIVARTTGSPANLPSIGDTTSTITGFETYQVWRCPDQTAAHAFTLPDPSKAGLCVRVIRDTFTTHGATFKRVDTTTVGTLAAVGAIDFHSYDDGGGTIEWHGAGMGGASAIS